MSLGWIFLVALHAATMATEYRYVSDGCLADGTYHLSQLMPITGQATVRCCSMDGTQCDSSLTGHCLPKSATFAEAEASCGKAGMKLCSKIELESGVCCGTGCDYDNELVWTSAVDKKGNGGRRSVFIDNNSSIHGDVEQRNDSNRGGPDDSNSHASGDINGNPSFWYLLFLGLLPVALPCIFTTAWVSGRLCYHCGVHNGAISDEGVCHKVYSDSAAVSIQQNTCVNTDPLASICVQSCACTESIPRSAQVSESIQPFACDGGRPSAESAVTMQLPDVILIAPVAGKTTCKDFRPLQQVSEAVPPFVCSNRRLSAEFCAYVTVQTPEVHLVSPVSSPGETQA
jgi:hypothetical protein